MAKKQDISTKLKIAPSPHIKGEMTTPKIMRTVLYSTVPICLFSVYLFGISDLSLILWTTFVTVSTEHLCSRYSKKGATTIGDYSAAVTGVLLALTLPPGFPLWMATVAGIIAIMLGKVVWGGLGHNILNPALAARAFIQWNFPTAISTWVPPFALHRFTEMIPTTLTKPGCIPPLLDSWIVTTGVDGFTGATPLTLFKFQHVSTSSLEMVTGFTSGSTGETCAILILLSFAYLTWKHIADWRIPVSIISGALILATILYLNNPIVYPDPLFVLTSGGLLFGAVFMATDPVGAPITPLGKIIFGLLIGFLVIVIRDFCSLPEGVMIAILAGNAFSPLIKKITKPRAYGTKRGAQ